MDDEPPSAHSSRLDIVFVGREHWEDFYQPQTRLPLFSDIKMVRLGVAVRSPLFELFSADGNPKGASIPVRIADFILDHLEMTV